MHNVFVARFDWDTQNVGHIGRHGVTPAEAEEVILGEPMEQGADVRGGERRAMFLGVTAAGRLLIVVVTTRRGKIRVVTAYPAGAAAKRRWAKFRRGEE